MLPLPRPLLFVFLSLASLFLSGCATFNGHDDVSLPTNGSAIQQSLSECTVELQKRRTKSITLPVTTDMRVQDVLEQTKAPSKFRRVDVTVLRKTDNPNNPVLRLASEYEPKYRQVSLQTDYGILPGDRIIIRESPTNSVDDMIKSFLGR